MKAIFLFLLPIVFLFSCQKAPAVKPALHLQKGERYEVKLEVNMSDRTSIISANVGGEKQRFEIGYEWEVIDVVSDTEFVIHSKIQSLESRLNRKKNFDDGVVIGNTIASDSVKLPVRYIPLDSVLHNIQSAEFDFRITVGGDITEVHGADSAIYSAFTKTYGDGPDSLFKADYFLLKSFFGNIAFANFTEQFFMAYPSTAGWLAGNDFQNIGEMHEQIETIDQDYLFYSRNEWDYTGKNNLGNHVLNLEGTFVNQKDQQANTVGFDLHVKGKQSGTIQYDSICFLPVNGKLDQHYEISSGMTNVIFSFKLSSFIVDRNLQLKINKLK
jgi:Family of unknown function (DUF6263)